MDEEVFDPNDIIQDILREEQEGSPNAHLRARDQYLREKDRLIGEKVQVKTVEWTVREDVRKAEVPPDKDYEKVGVWGFDFNKTYVRCGKRNANRRISFLDLLIKLWPGDWCGQLRQLNLRIRLDNAISKSQCRYGRPNLNREITENEFWIFWGLILSARLFGWNGDLWDKCDPEGIRSRVDMSNHMSEGRFNLIRRCIPFLWAKNPGSDDEDPW